MLLLFIVIFTFLQLSATQNRSPCRDVFTYEEGNSEQDRWYGQVKLTTNSTLYGVWLRIGLDQPADLLGNWFGGSTSDDNKSFLIANRNYQLEPNRSLAIRFFVKYKTEGTIPKVSIIKLNGRTICLSTVDEIITTTTTTKPQPRVKDARINIDQEPPNNKQSINEANNDDVDLFPGDFSSPLLPYISAEEEKCGTVKIPVLPLITYGQSTTEGAWPWHVALYRNKGIVFQYVCGGSLISPNHIITAAYCVTKPGTSLAFDQDLFIVYLGKYNLYKLGLNVQNNGVKKITVHPKFNATYFYNNVAVLQLEIPAQISDFVRPVCLWEEDVNLNSITEKLGTVVGCGYDQNAMITETLMQATMPVVTTERCIFSNRDFFSLFTSDATYCAGFNNGTSTCVGDSGGGMVFPKGGGHGQNVVWQLRGIVSLTVATKTKIVCDTSNYVVFTDVAKHLDWIRNVMNS